QTFKIPADGAVTSDHQIMLFSLLNQLAVSRTISAVVNHDFKAGYESMGLPCPVSHHGSRRYDQGRSLCFAASSFHSEQSKKLKGLAQPHVIGKHCSHVVS